MLTALIVSLCLTAEPLKPAADVLREGEVSGGKLVLQGDGVLIQVPATFQVTDRKGAAAAASGSIKGMLGPVDGLIYLTREPFKGTLPKWIAAEKAKVTKAGGKVPNETEAKVFDKTGWNLVGHQIEIKETGKYTFARFVLVKGVVYGAHCELVDQDGSAYASAGSDCAIAVGTLHVGPAR